MAITVEFTARIEHALVRTSEGDFLVFPDEHVEVMNGDAASYEISNHHFADPHDYEVVLRAGLQRLGMMRG